MVWIFFKKDMFFKQLMNQYIIKNNISKKQFTCHVILQNPDQKLKREKLKGSNFVYRV